MVKNILSGRCGEYVDTPVMTMNLQKSLTRRVSGFIRQKDKVYFSDKDVMNLVPEYRVISRVRRHSR